MLNRTAEMEYTEKNIIRITREFHISQARQTGKRVAESLGFGKTECCIIVTGISELANNLICHTIHGGTLVISTVMRDGRKGIEITAEDEGPGISDIALAMQDGYSTCGGLGSGLGGVKRMMQEFEIASVPGKGTRVTARKWR